MPQQNHQFMIMMQELQDPLTDQYSQNDNWSVNHVSFTFRTCIYYQVISSRIFLSYIWSLKLGARKYAGIY